MLSKILRPWQDNRTKQQVKAENQNKGFKELAVSKKVQQLVLNCYDYFCKLIPKKYITVTVYFFEKLPAGACDFTKNDFLQVILGDLC